MTIFGRFLTFSATCLLLTQCSITEGWEDFNEASTAEITETGGSSPDVPKQLHLDHMNDTARFLAGMEGAQVSAFANLRLTPTWQAHKQQMDEKFRNFEGTRQKAVMNWQATELADLRPRYVFYPFSGPDYAFAHAFFPGASTYVLCGLEGAQPLPDTSAMNPTELSAALGNLRQSMNSLLLYSYFITKDMRVDLEKTALRGTLPPVLVFLARSNHTLESVDLVYIGEGGSIIPRQTTAQDTPGYRIIARDINGQRKTIYYFQENLANGALASDARFLRFAAGQGTPVTYLKSASYLMHSSEFSRIRSFILQNSRAVLQDPSGIPFSQFTEGPWNVSLYGNYTGPLDIFSSYFQSDLVNAYRSGAYRTGPMPIGLGYKQESLQLARKRSSLPLTTTQVLPPAP